jgi:hypothetical protein
MTAAAEKVVKDIQGLPLEELREIWRQLDRLVVETPAGSTSDAEFDAALAEVTGCTAQQNATGRWLAERQRIPALPACG